YARGFREQFKPQMHSISAEGMNSTLNQVHPPFIREEADECTYNLHIILRFEIELALIEGDLKEANVPEISNQKMSEYLGLDVPDDAMGCLQDIDWAHGSIGYVPTYALGNLYAGQLFRQ